MVNFMLLQPHNKGDIAFLVIRQAVPFSVENDLSTVLDAMRNMYGPRSFYFLLIRQVKSSPWRMIFPPFLMPCGICTVPDLSISFSSGKSNPLPLHVSHCRWVCSIIGPCLTRCLTCPEPSHFLQSYLLVACLIFHFRLIADPLYTSSRVISTVCVIIFGLGGP